MNQKNIDIFVTIIDNFGDIWFVLETILYFQNKYPNQYFFTIWTNEDLKLQKIFELNNLTDNIKIDNVDNWRKFGEVAISFLHSDFPNGEYGLVLRVDYLSLNDDWLEYNNKFHISSTEKNKIIELIPSPKNSGSWLLPKVEPSFDKEFYLDFLCKNFANFDKNKKIFSIFCYNDTFEKIIFDDFSHNYNILIFWVKNQDFQNLPENVYFMPFLDIVKFYNILHFSDYIITRGEASFMQVLQFGKPFLWDIYHTIWGFPEDQSMEFLDFLWVSENFANLQKKLWHSDKIAISEIIDWLENSKKFFQKREYKNFAEEIKNFL